MMGIVLLCREYLGMGGQGIQTVRRCRDDTALIVLMGNLAHYLLIPCQNWKLVSHRKCEIRFFGSPHVRK